MSQASDNASAEGGSCVSGDSESSRWCFEEDSNVLVVHRERCAGGDCFELSAEQCLQIREFGAATEWLRLVVGDGRDQDLVLIGKKVGVGTWGGLVCRADDVDGVLIAMQTALRFSEQIVSGANSLVVVIDRDYKVRRFNKLCEEHSGLKEVDMVGIDAHQLFLPSSHQADARANIAKFFDSGASYETVTPVNSLSGQRQIHWRNSLVRDGSDGDTYLVCSGVDITDDLANKQRLHRHATQDYVTGLPNGYASRLLVEEAIRTNSPVSILTLGVLDYRSLRGLLGLSQSEALMKQVADTIVEAVPSDWNVSRLGGPEFRLQAKGARPEQELAAISATLLHELSRTFVVSGVQIRLHAAIGAACVPEHASTADELEMAVDAAMHAAASRAGSKFELYASQMRDELAEGLWLNAQLHEALNRNEFELWYQPKVSLTDGTIDSVEALIRWKHPHLGYIPPDRFIPRAETSGIIVQIGRWVVAAATAQAEAWAAEGRSLRISVNVSAKQLTHDKELTEVLRNAQARCHGLIDVELTESSFLEDAQTARAFIACCRALGCGVHLDDFGSGYSSLGQLVNLDLTAVKLDRTFISDSADPVKQHALLEAVVRLAQALNLDVIAEGVETEATAEKLRSIGVRYAQGWHYSKAVPADDLGAWLGRVRLAG